MEQYLDYVLPIAVSIFVLVYGLGKAWVFKKLSVKENERQSYEGVEDAVSKLWTKGVGTYASVRELKKNQDGKLTDRQKADYSTLAKKEAFDILKGPLKDFFLTVADERKDRWIEQAVTKLKGGV